jgi:hypothetical protein
LCCVWCRRLGILARLFYSHRREKISPVSLLIGVRDYGESCITESLLVRYIHNKKYVYTYIFVHIENTRS